MTALLAALWLNLGNAEPVCAKKPVTLRKSAGDGAPVSWKVPRYMPFLRIGQKSGWSKLQDFEGEVHWARAGDVTTALRCVVVKANVANLHKDPSPGSPASDLKSVDRYTPLLRVADQGDWMQVKDEAGHLSWIQTAQVWKPVVINAISF